MSRFFSRYRWELLWLVGLTIVYLALRLPHLTLQPIFADEAIYIRWAQVMRAEPTLRFLPLSDGKTPLFMWMMIPLFKVFHDPLMAGRVLSVFAGLGTLYGVYFLGRNFINQLTAYWASLLVVVTPFIFFFDRMALVDSMLSAVTVWCFYVGFWLIKNPRLDLAMGLGYLLGGGVLVKTPGYFNFVTLPFTLTTFNWLAKRRWTRLAKLLGLWLVAYLIGTIIYNILRLGPGFSNLSGRNEDYIHSPSWLLAHPFDPLLPHLHDLWLILPNMLTWPILLLAIVGLVLALYRRQLTGWAIILWSLGPLVVLLALLQTFTARYILFCMPGMLLLAGYALSQLLAKPGRLLSIIVALVIVAWPLYYDWLLLTNPAKAPLPAEERRGYLEDWTAGYGFPQIAQYLSQQAQQQPVVVGTEGYFGTLPDGLQIYLDQDRAVTVIGGPASVSAQLRQAALDHPTYFVANKSRYQVYAANIKLLQEYDKPTSPGNFADAILFFQVFADKR